MTAAFRAALVHQAAVVLAAAVLAALAWGAVRARRARSGAAGHRGRHRAAAERGGRQAWSAEPPARRLIRLGFGLLWVLDGILQAQPAMAAGMPSQVVEPAAAGSPGWLQHLVAWSSAGWSGHPVLAATAAVWVQLGIGIAMIAAAGGLWSRATGLASVGWGLSVWVFGEALGGMLAPGLSWLTGAPGAVAFYCVAGVLLALPAGAWRGPRLGRVVLAAAGTFFLGMALLQAWPGRGFWQGRIGGQPGALAAVTASMAQVRQPSLTAGWVSAFTSLDEAHGFAVNLFTVTALAVTGLAMVTAWRRVLLPAVTVTVALCLATWVLVQDFGFFGGTGTDPNSMIPVALLVAGGYLALTRFPAARTAAAPAAPAAQVAQVALAPAAPAARPGPAREPAGLEREPAAAAPWGPALPVRSGPAGPGR